MAMAMMEQTKMRPRLHSFWIVLGPSTKTKKISPRPSRRTPQPVPLLEAAIGRFKLENKVVLVADLS